MLPRQIVYRMNYLPRLTLSDPEKLGFKFSNDLVTTIGLDQGVVMLGRARAGIYLLIKESISPARKKVVLSPFTLPDVVNMIRFAGGVPVFVDCMPKSTNIDPDHLRSLIDHETCAVIITHYHVNQDQFDVIQTICRDSDALLFEDCAISIGGTISGAPVGSLSDGGVYSFSSYKFLNYLWGGAITSKHKKLLAALNNEVEIWPRLKYQDYRKQMLRTIKYDVATRPSIFKYFTGPLIRRSQGNQVTPVSLKQYRVESKCLDRTLTSRPSINAIVELSSKLNEIDDNLTHRRNIAAIYLESFKEIMVGAESSVGTINGSCFVNFPVIVDASRRDSVYKAMIRAGFDVGLAHYPNCHQHPEFRDCQGKSQSVSDLVHSILTLPTHPRIDADYAISLRDRLWRELNG